MIVDSFDISIATFCYSSLTVDILRSRCIASLVTYQCAYKCAFIRDLCVFDWKRWSISMLELLAVPHSWIPLVQTGFITVL